MADDDIMRHGTRLSPKLWETPSLIGEMLEALRRGTHPTGRMVAGRIVAVLATPDAASASDVALGFSAIPSGHSTEEHSHRAEEIAFVLSGNADVFVDDVLLKARPGSVILTPSHAKHRTVVTGETPLLQLWVYAPAGSERRWLPSDAKADEVEMQRLEFIDSSADDPRGRGEDSRQ